MMENHNEVTALRGIIEICMGTENGLDDFHTSLPTLTFLWFCECMYDSIFLFEYFRGYYFLTLFSSFKKKSQVCTVFSSPWKMTVSCHDDFRLWCSLNTAWRHIDCFCTHVICSSYWHYLSPSGNNIDIFISKGSTRILLYGGILGSEMQLNVLQKTS